MLRSETCIVLCVRCLSWTGSSGGVARCCRRWVTPACKRTMESRDLPTLSENRSSHSSGPGQRGELVPFPAARLGHERTDSFAVATKARGRKLLIHRRHRSPQLSPRP
jgi:hypothetical protein